MKILLVKTSSLGDLVHAMPAVNDAVDLGFEIDWVVEEAFSEIAELHGGVSKVIPVAWRRWRKSLISSCDEMLSFKSELRQNCYDVCLDSQGLLKSGAFSLLSRCNIRAGYDYGSAREPVVSFFYNKRIFVPKNLHAIDRQRQLFSRALNYRLQGEPDAGIEKTTHSKKRQIFLLHGTTWKSKRWPIDCWIRLASKAKSEGIDVVLSWGSELERLDAEIIAARSGITLLPKMGLKQLSAKLSESQAVVGVDTGLMHLSAAMGIPTLGLYGPTRTDLTGCRGRHVKTLQSRAMDGITFESVWSGIEELSRLPRS